MSPTNHLGGLPRLVKQLRISSIFTHNISSHALHDADYASNVLKRNQVKSMITSAKAQYDEILIQNFTSNPKALYGYIRDKNKVKTSIGQLEKPDGTLTDGDNEVVEVLSDFFQSVFTREDPSFVPKVTPKVGCTLNEIYITESEVY